MADAFPTPSEPADSPTGSDRVFAQPSAEDSAARRAEEKAKAIKRRAHRKSRFGCKKCKVRRIKVLSCSVLGYELHADSISVR